MTFCLCGVWRRKEGAHTHTQVDLELSQVYCDDQHQAPPILLLIHRVKIVFCKKEFRRIESVGKKESDFFTIET